VGTEGRIWGRDDNILSCEGRIGLGFCTLLWGSGKRSDVARLIRLQSGNSDVRDGLCC